MPGRVLIFDDDTDLLEVCGIVLKSKNYIVFGVNKCNDVLNEVRAFSPDVVLMDNWIPEVGGVNATQQIKNDHILRSIPVIFFSANDHVESLATEAGAEFFLQKPFDIDELESVVSKAVATHRQSAVPATR